MSIHALAPPDIVFVSTECWTAEAAKNVLSEPFVCKPHRVDLPIDTRGMLARIF